MMGDERQFDWESLVPQVVDPTKVAIVEAMHWIRFPLSALELSRVFDDEHQLSLVAYHLDTLASLGVVKQIGTRSVDGAIRRFYALRARTF